MQQAPGRSIRRAATTRPKDIGQLADRTENGEGQSLLTSHVA
jgi:hypothetical protein